MPCIFPSRKKDMQVWKPRKSFGFFPLNRHPDQKGFSDISCRIKRVKVCKGNQFLDPYFKLGASYSSGTARMRHGLSPSVPDRGIVFGSKFGAWHSAEPGNQKETMKSTLH